MKKNLKYWAVLALTSYCCSTAIGGVVKANTMSAKAIGWSFGAIATIELSIFGGIKLKELNENCQSAKAKVASLTRDLKKDKEHIEILEKQLIEKEEEIKKLKHSAEMAAVSQKDIENKNSQILALRKSIQERQNETKASVAELQSQKGNIEILKKQLIEKEEEIKKLKHSAEMSAVSQKDIENKNNQILALEKSIREKQNEINSITAEMQKQTDYWKYIHEKFEETQKKLNDKLPEFEEFKNLANEKYKTTDIDELHKELGKISKKYPCMMSKEVWTPEDQNKEEELNSLIGCFRDMNSLHGILAKYSEDLDTEFSMHIWAWRNDFLEEAKIKTGKVDYVLGDHDFQSTAGLSTKGTKLVWPIFTELIFGNQDNGWDKDLPGGRFYNTGWKIHIAPKVQHCSKVLDLVSNYIKENHENTGFKFCSDLSFYRHINQSPTQRGKFITIYCISDKEAAQISQNLNKIFQENGLDPDSFLTVPKDFKVFPGIFTRFCQYDKENDDSRSVLGMDKSLLQDYVWNINRNTVKEEHSAMFSPYHEQLVKEYEHPFEHLYAGKEDNEVPKKVTEINQYLKDHKIESNV